MKKKGSKGEGGRSNGQMIEKKTNFGTKRVNVCSSMSKVKAKENFYSRFIPKKIEGIRVKKREGKVKSLAWYW